MSVPLYLADDKFEGYVPDPFVATLRTLFNKDTVDNTEGCDPSVFNIKTMLTTPSSGEEYVRDQLTDSATASDELLRIRLFGAPASDTQEEEEPPVDLTDSGLTFSGDEGTGENTGGENTNTDDTNQNSDPGQETGQNGEQGGQREASADQTVPVSPPETPKPGKGKGKKAAEPQA